MSLFQLHLPERATSNGFYNGLIAANLEGCIVIKKAQCFLDVEQFDFKDRIGELRHKQQRRI